MLYLIQPQLTAVHELTRRELNRNAVANKSLMLR